MRTLYAVAVLFSASIYGALIMSADSMVIVSRDQFCVTEGQITPGANHWMRVDSTKMRAVLGLPSPPKAELHFRFLGETQEHSELRSGAERTQIGLKLRAQSDCNVVYVMWRIRPVSKLAVQVKSNPGQNTHAECQNSGYTNMKASREEPLPTLEEGSEHSLRASLDGRSLVVVVDDRPVWQGEISEEALRFDGPVGIRSDNARFEFQYLAEPTGTAFSCGHWHKE